MQEVKIAELKARLSHYLRLAQSGEEVLVKDRERPVARLIPFEPTPPLDLDLPRRVSREEAKKILASIPRPKLTRSVVEGTLRWMKKDRSDDWFRKK